MYPQTLRFALSYLFKIQMLFDQHDFLVIGVLGTQGAGKSTVMSALAADGRTKYVVVYATHTTI